MGHRERQKAEDQAGSTSDRLIPVSFSKPVVPQSITIIPRKNRLRIYVDGPDKYYRLRELKRALPEVVVKVRSLIAYSLAI